MQPMRRLGGAILIAGVLLASNSQPTFSDGDLTALVNAAYPDRTEDASLHALAHERAQYQVTFSGGVCSETALTHDGLITAEVLACNFTGPGRAVEQWQGSPVHHSLLSDPAYNLIGCGSAAGSDGSTFYACTLSTATVAQPTPAPVVPGPPAEATPPAVSTDRPGPGETPAPLTLPDTATEGP